MLMTFQIIHCVNTDYIYTLPQHRNTLDLVAEKMVAFIYLFLALTGSIKGQSAAEPHAARQQRDTADYRVTARHTMDGGCLARGRGSGREMEDGNRDRLGWCWEGGGVWVYI